MQTWSITARIRNKLMHICNGNSPNQTDQIILSVANTNGLSTEGRWEQVLQRCEGVTIISETHCTDVVQKSLPFRAVDFQVIWGAPVRKGSRSGVALLIKRGCFWQAKAVPLHDSPCKKYYDEGRLVVGQVFYKGGTRSLLIYGLYGHAGARWDQPRKDLVEAMLTDIAQDIVSRGSTAAIIAGDFNVQVCESRLIKKNLHTTTWFDAVAFGTPTEQIKQTSHAKNGSRIDMLFANDIAARLLTSYKVVPGVLPKDHSEVLVTMTLPVGHQCKYVPHQPNEHFDIPYDKPPAMYHPPVIDCNKTLSPLLARGDIDSAFKEWCNLAQSCLRKIPRTKNNCTVYDQGTSRGSIRFQKQCAFPKQREAHTLNLHSRRIAVAIGRIDELARARVHGAQSQRTWKNLAKVLVSLQP